MNETVNSPSYQQGNNLGLTSNTEAYFVLNSLAKGVSSFVKNNKSAFAVEKMCVKFSKKGTLNERLLSAQSVCRVKSGAVGRLGEK